MKNILLIVKKELQGYFNSPTAYVVLVAFLLLWQFLFFRGVFLVGQASLISMFDTLPWIFLLFIPALTMGSIAQEKSQGTIEFLLTRPIREIELLAGKFIGSLLFVAIALLFIFPIAWSLNKFGDLDWGVVFGQYLASVCMAMVFVSLGIFISSIFKSQISSLLTTAIASFFLVIIGFDIATARFPLSFVPYFEYSSVLSHFASMARGVIDVRDLWYFVSAIAIFLSLAYVMLLKDKYGNWKKINRNTQLGIAMIVAIALVSNVATSRIATRIDLTEEKIFTLSEPTKKVLGGLDDIVNVTFYRSEQLPSQFQPILRQIKDTLRDYETFSDGNITVSEKNPTTDPALAREAMAAGVQEVRFNVISQEEFQIKTGYLGIAVSYGGEHESIPFVQNTNDLEYQLTSFIRKLTLEEKPSVVFVTGHGEKSISSGYTILNRELSKEFDVQEISTSAAELDDPNAQPDEADNELEQAEEFEIPDDTTVLVLGGPNEEVDENTRNKIKAFINKGGSVLYLLDSILVIPQMLTANANENSFSDFISDEYGISIKENIAYDLRSNETVNFSSGQMRYFLSYPFWVKTTRPEQTPIASKVDNVVMAWASSLSIEEDKIDSKDLEIIRLLSTTETGATQSGQFNLSPEQNFSSKGLGQELLAVAAKPTEGTGGAARFVVVGDSDFLSDQFAGSNPQNLAFGIEVISWLAQEESLTAIRLKNITDRSMIFEDDKQPNTTKYGNMAFALLVPAGFGAYRLTRRKKIRQLTYGQK